MAKDVNKMHLEFTVPTVNSDWQVVESDPFYIRQEKNDTVCKLAYAGPTRLIIENKNHCVHPIDNQRDDLVLLPNTNCYRSEWDNITLFSSLECKPLRYDNVED